MSSYPTLRTTIIIIIIISAYTSPVADERPPPPPPEKNSFEWRKGVGGENFCEKSLPNQVEIDD